MWNDPFPAHHNIGDIAFQAADIDWLIDLATAARKLATRITDTTANTWKGVVPLDRTISLFDAPFGNHGDVTLCALSGRAGITARCDAALVDSECIGRALWIQLVGRAPSDQQAVKIIFTRHRADFGAFAAGRAFIRVNKPGPGMQGCGKVTRFSRHLYHFAIGQDIHIQMLFGVDQARRNRAHGAIIGWKRFVQTRHVAAYGRIFFDHEDLVAGVGEIKRGLHTRNAAADNKGSTSRIVFVRCQTIVMVMDCIKWHMPVSLYIMDSANSPKLV